EGPPGQPADGRCGEGHDRDRWREVTGVDGLRVLLDEPSPPLPRPEVLPGQGTQVGTRAVGHGQLGSEPDDTPQLPDPPVHLPVLGTRIRGVVATHPAQPVPPERPEEDGLGGPGLPPDVEPGAANYQR